MTIKQQGGIFGRNPSFNDVEASQGTFSNLTSTTSMVSGGSNKTVGSYGNSHVRSDSNAAAYNGGNLSFGGASVATGNQYIFGGLKFMSDPASGTGWDTYASLYLTNADSSVSEKVFFKNNGDINPTGNIVVNSGKGIDFSATSGTGTSELFDDYEEGTFTPTLYGNSTAGTYELATASGTYTKIGRVVTAQVIFVLASSVTGGGSGDTVIGGLPFTYDGSENVGQHSAVASGGISFAAGATVTASKITSSDDTRLTLYESVAGTSIATVPITDFGANDLVAFTVTYFSI